jgi:hypothetical protein
MERGARSDARAGGVADLRITTRSAGARAALSHRATRPATTAATQAAAKSDGTAPIQAGCGEIGLRARTRSSAPPNARQRLCAWFAEPDVSAHRRSSSFFPPRFRRADPRRTSSQHVRQVPAGGRRCPRDRVRGRCARPKLDEPEAPQRPFFARFAVPRNGPKSEVGLTSVIRPRPRPNTDLVERRLNHRAWRVRLARHGAFLERHTDTIRIAGRRLDDCSGRPQISRAAVDSTTLAEPHHSAP